MIRDVGWKGSLWQERLRAARRVFNDPDQAEKIVEMLGGAGGRNMRPSGNFRRCPPMAKRGHLGRNGMKPTRMWRMASEQQLLRSLPRAKRRQTREAPDGHC